LETLNLTQQKQPFVSKDSIT